MKRKEIKTELVAIAQRNFYESKKRKPRRSNFWHNTIIASLIGCVIIPATIYAGAVGTKPKEAVSIPSDYYAATMVVREINHLNDLVKIENVANGIIYDFHGIYNWNIGDVCSVLMDNIGTENPADDVIIMKWETGHRIRDNERS